MATVSPNTAPTFVAGGKVITHVGSGNNFGYSVVVQADGKIIVSGGAGLDGFTLLRYTSEGTLDPTFDGDGIRTEFGGVAAYSVKLQPDGHIVVAGYTGNSGQRDFTLMRFNANGSLDTSFDADGKVITSIASGNDVPYSIALQADGKIIAAGYSNNGTDKDFALVRYNVNGSLDTTFSADGKVTTPIHSRFGDTSGPDFGNSVTLQPDGKIIVGGSSWIAGGSGANDQFALARYNANGSLDTTFSGDGIIVIGSLGGYQDLGRAVALQSDGKILLAGTTNGQFSLVRVTANGTLDTTFDGDGRVTTAIGPSFGSAKSIAIQADGKILVAGNSLNSNGDYDFAVVRYNTNGSLDTTFDGDGKVTTAIGSGHDTSYGMTLQADGKILVVGYGVASNGFTDFELVRYNVDGSLDQTFARTSSVNGAVSYVENGPAVVLDSDVQISDAELAAQGNYAGASITLTRNGGPNAQDAYSATGLLGPLTQGATLTYDGVNVGTVTSNSAGTLILTFNSAATPARAEGVLESIAYANNSDAPPSSVQIAWTFSDGNTGAQGSGGALSATGMTTVTIVHVNDAPSFSGGPNEVVAPNTNARTVPHWATSISAGPSDESEQALSFIVTNDNAALFSSAPAISPDGTLTYALAAGASGVANVTVLLHDNGGTSNGGADTSASQMFSIATGTTLNGGSGADLITGSAANESLNGLGGNDRIIGGAGNDTLTGGAGHNYLVGGAGNDTLDGRGGEASQLQGGTGDDVYRVDNYTDSLIEFAGEGTDAVLTALASYALRENIENLFFTGAGSFYGKGNALNNFIRGGTGDDLLNGEAGNDSLVGTGGGDYLVGGSGNDTLDATGSTQSQLQGGVGDDTYIVTSSRDTLVEFAGEGTDTVQTTLSSYTLRNNFENLTYTGAGAFSGTGNAAANALIGGSGNDVLTGGLGSDRLTGGVGSDRFDYNSINEGLDTITDFTRGTGGDKVDVKDILVGYNPGASNINNFVHLTGTASTVVSVNADGIGSDFVALTTLQGVANSATLLNELIAQGNLIVS